MIARKPFHAVSRRLPVRSFEYRDAKSAKFWNIDLQGNSFTVTYGKIGTAGQSQTKSFPTAEKAQAEHDKLVREKTGKGYLETGAGAAPLSDDKVLELALFDNPGDLAAHAAYADLLAEKGDPRGEFIQTQLALEDPLRPAAERKKLQTREAKLLAEHARTWLGPLAEFLLDQDGTNEYPPKNAFQFARGWLDHVFVGVLNVNFARALVKATQLRLLRDLVIEAEQYAGEEEFDDDEDAPEGEHPAFDTLSQSGQFMNLRKLRLGEVSEGEYATSCHLGLTDIVALLKRMPRLEEAQLLIHGVDVKALFSMKTLTHLRVLRLYHTHAVPLEVLAKNPAFANLEQLYVFPHGLEYDAEPYVNLEGVAALLKSPHIKKLTHLELRANSMGDEGIDALIASGRLTQLEHLDLMHGRVTDQGAIKLAACPDVKHLKYLDLSYNRLTKAGVAALEKTGVNLKGGKQYGPNDDEQQYLWCGDPE
jgi:uncharacterized protein (TIGR02996 family)